MRVKTNMEQLAKADWAHLEQDVVAKIRMLQTICAKLPQDELSDKIANELILPALQLLAEFCACVEVTDEDVPKKTDVRGCS